MYVCACIPFQPSCPMPKIHLSMIESLRTAGLIEASLVTRGAKRLAWKPPGEEVDVCVCFV